MAASWAVIWDSACDFLHGKSQALSEGSAVKPAIRGSPMHSQSFTARLKSCPDTKQSFSVACEARTLHRLETTGFRINARRPGRRPRPSWLHLNVRLAAEEQDAGGLVFSHFAHRPVKELVVLEIDLQESRTL